MADESKDIYEAYYYVKQGKKREAVLKLLAHYRTPTEIVKILKTHPKVVSEILKGVAVAVSGIKSQLSVPQITELMKNIDLDVEDFAVAQEITSEGMTDMNLAII